MKAHRASRRVAYIVAVAGFAMALGASGVSPVTLIEDGSVIGAAIAQTPRKAKERAEERIEEQTRERHRDCEIRKDGSRDPECDGMADPRQERDEATERRRRREQVESGGGSSGGGGRK